MSSIGLSRCVEYPFQSVFIRLKRNQYWLPYYRWLDANTDREQGTVYTSSPSCTVNGFRYFNIMDECEVA